MFRQLTWERLRLIARSEYVRRTSLLAAAEVAESPRYEGGGEAVRGHQCTHAAWLDTANEFNRKIFIAEKW